MLTEWFERNRVDVDARDLFYSQFPNKYVWDARQKEWIVRSRGFCLGRIVYVHPAAGELYFLRMLLNHVKGAKNFEDLRQISGTIFPTFQLACKALGLLGDDKEWSDAFGEAIPTASSPQLRQLFINIIMFCEVADPNSLFDQFWHSMHDDIEYHLRSSFSMLNVRFSDDELKNYVLYELEQLFNASGTSLEDHKLPMPNGRLMDEVRNKLLREELNYDLAELRNNHSLAMPLLNPCQRNIYDSVITSILQKKQALIFVHGHGGTGKTFLWHTIINRVRSEGSVVLAVASSGIASLLLPGGRTAHSRFKIPLEVNESSTCEIKHNTHLSRLLEMTSLIVWDEAPMNNRFCFEALDRSLRDVLRLNNPFGGKSILLGGDFRQILPVIPGGTKEEIINASFTSSLLWSAFTFLTLNQNMRLSAEGLSPDQKDELRQFAEWILLIGDGQICDLAVSDDHDAAFIKIPCELQVEVIDSPIAAIVSAIYPDIERAHLDPFYFKDRAIVTPKNLTVSEINNFILDIIPGHKYNFLSCDSIQTTSGDIDNIDLLYPIEFINQLDFNGVPQHSISLKIGTPIMLLRNLNPSAGLCNGTRLIVTQLAERIIEAQIITGSNIGDRVFIPRIVFPVNDKKCPFTIKRRQFPIRPCYAMTINKSQGQSLKIVGVFLKEQVFSHGQLYVALSRATSKNGLKIISLDHEGKPSCYAKNIVYKDIIQLLPKGNLCIHCCIFCVFKFLIHNLEHL
ncbi:DNA helicase [Populus alba x Populus x berolinensis]|nr:DNA helicase [Populus alba x Populus x berolinensis]